MASRDSDLEKLHPEMRKKVGSLLKLLADEDLQALTRGVRAFPKKRRRGRPSGGSSRRQASSDVGDATSGDLRQQRRS